MRSIVSVILKWLVFIDNKKAYRMLKRKGKCKGKDCPDNCCQHLLGFIRCPYLSKEHLCKLQNNKPYACIHTPTILDNVKPHCGYYHKEKFIDHDLETKLILFLFVLFCSISFLFIMIRVIYLTWG